MWRATVEWAIFPKMLVLVKTVTLCQGSVGVPSCGCKGRRGSSGFLLCRRSTEKGVSLLC